MPSANTPKVLIHFTASKPHVCLTLIQTDQSFNVNYTMPEGGGIQESFNTYSQAWTAMNHYIAQAMKEQASQKERDGHAC